MSRWECRLTSQREDGCFTWKRVDAESPRGTLPIAMAPIGAAVGDVVVIEATHSMGRLEVIACEALGARPPEAPPQRESTPVVLPGYREPIELQPGQVRWADVRNPLENPDATGKIRPVVLVEGDSRTWRVMGLTTNDSYASGSPRVSIPDWYSVGLSGPGYLWGGKLTRITTESVHGFIGWSDEPLIEAIVSVAVADLSSGEIDGLRTSARLHQRQHPAHSTSVGRDIRLSASSLIEFLTTSETVKDDLIAYFRSGRYTGRDFEHFASIADPNWFDGNHVAAVMALSVAVRAHIRFDVQLVTLRRDDKIWDLPRHAYLPGSPLSELWKELVAIEDIASTIASKLLASRFRHAVPIWDRDVSRLLGGPREWWLGWYDAMQEHELRTTLEELRHDLDLGHVSLLRIADVALWMESQRRKGSPA
jgi:hypothetical protein